MAEAIDVRQASTRVRWRGVALPNEHGGWSLTLEPVLLGLLVEPSWSGVLLGLAALAAFLARTPLKLALADRRRGRRLARTVAAERFASAFMLGLAVAAAGAVLTARAPFWAPLAAATPLVAIGFAYDVRSRSRHLVPELLGAVGIGSAAAAIVLAGGGEVTVAFGMWLVIAARAGAAILHVRVQLRRAKRQRPQRWHNDVAQLAVVTTSLLGGAAGWIPVRGVIAIVAMAVAHLILARRPPVRTALIGLQQVAIGLFVVLTTGVGL